MTPKEFENQLGIINQKIKSGVEKVTVDAVQEKLDRIAAYRQEASRLASLANKRLKRLEEKGLQDTPAYQSYLKYGGEKFSVRGKSYNDLQSEMARMKRFIDSKTSTIRGVNSTLKDIAKNTNIKYKNLVDLRKKASKFFELSSKVEQYLRTVDDMASAISYKQIWESIDEYVTTNVKALDGADNDIDKMIEAVTKAIKEYDDPVELDFRTELQGIAGLTVDNEWYQLPKN